MEKGKKNGKVGASADALFLVDIMAEIRPLLEDAGLIQPGGLIIFSENIGAIDEIKHFFRRTGAVQCKKLAVPEGTIPNNKIAFHIHQKFDKEVDELKFLAEGGFTPVILVHSFIPEHLRDSCRLIVLERKLEFLDVDIQLGKSFKNFVHKKPEFLEKNIELFKSSEFYLQHKWDEEMDMALEASANAFCGFYRLEHTEEESEGLHTYFRGLVEALLEWEEHFSGEWDILDAVRNVIENYLEENAEVKMGSKDAVEGDLAEANQNSQAILWDDAFYYFPEKLFRYACGSLLEMVSFPEIKREMAEQGFLRCHKIADGNFTIKKTIVNVYGHRVRQRFIVIERGFFDLEGELTLAERRDVSCTLELSMENPAE